ncbi:MAG: hypothetical protein CLLPBCKN_003799 [Chroococcidiopsis cubana SAG 39.79]|uniref:Methyltransferase type 11 domain-containing protein n=1 Tax=Chroococcidiopsis cubana SAG 39.79 TaxID=388085 RepID=A0AB37URJ2_9CYAN|nr:MULTISPECIES: methyltransferase domain-containing protein [Chroococcidiopsis]MDZ4874403.1 hypothetical protein [Chroococcidiopsis cubana SAG 39.79]PSB64680.1 hypothetical protein C7B79_08655 [Chroococcidiopsis cubana CCALA 043]RUT13987.1 hypothetical protein DSM107010_08870 [Chroococcidiopsis cubana SAG 39.79]URD51956.1 class I SAM-dependent methyltransferase [Chroococcidiopsis sp. CCNUC1]
MSQFDSIGQLFPPKTKGFSEQLKKIFNNGKQLLPKSFKQSAKQALKPLFMLKTRVELLQVGVQPLAENWCERGDSAHRVYLDWYLQKFTADIKGHCLEFQDDTYTSRFRDRITKLDVLNKDYIPNATIVADLTQPNDLPSNTYDCIICTYVLHIIAEPEKIVSEMHRILKPGGVLLIAVPNITINYPAYPEYWRFTARGLHYILAKSFLAEQIDIQTYGNSLVAAGELRGMVAYDFAKAKLEYNDPRFPLIVCARAVKSEQ